jgi:SpoVK/Ycf46/Vps4 family AAA+-type ATPase
VWDHIYLKHPVTFDTLAMDPAKKKEIMDDLDAFRKGKEYYARVGKAWKRGYLLYGPPGTGKSSMIAAMANYLNYDIYDVELTVVRQNHDLRKLLVEITDKSIIIIEDIDCSLDLTGERRRRRKERRSSSSSGGGSVSDDDDKPSKVTLSGLLNFVDGLWSACGSERIVVLTTNHVDKLDPALIRRGRMDKHIEMSYCCFEAFRTLAKNHLCVDTHPLFGAVEELLREVKVTPADVAECLLTSTREGHGVDSTLEHLIEEVKKSEIIKPDAAAEKKRRRRRRRKKRQQEEEDEVKAEADAEEAAAAAAESAEQEETI